MRCIFAVVLACALAFLVYLWNGLSTFGLFVWEDEVAKAVLLDYRKDGLDAFYTIPSCGDLVIICNFYKPQSTNMMISLCHQQDIDSCEHRYVVKTIIQAEEIILDHPEYIESNLTSNFCDGKISIPTRLRYRYDTVQGIYTDSLPRMEIEQLDNMRKPGY